MSLPTALINLVFVKELKNTPAEVEKMRINGEEVVALFKSIRDFGEITKKLFILISKN
ncbi:hypothetical protein [Fusobacterium sp.]|uniref:hypothetical protein n=1 Tax=Fusobacterium sp. TaxID=68766 RepID=UPI00262C1AE4|nr:hypothetical protein [Fusobacterium sp.]